MHVSVVSWKRSLITFKYNSDPYSITILLQNGIIEGREYEESSTLTFPVESYPWEWSVLSNNNMYIFFLSHIVIRRRTIPHADQLRVVSTAWHWLSHGKAWHVLRWCVRFLIRIVLELTKRFDFPSIFIVINRPESCRGQVGFEFDVFFDQSDYWTDGRQNLNRDRSRGFFSQVRYFRMAITRDFHKLLEIFQNVSRNFLKSYFL